MPQKGKKSAPKTAKTYTSESLLLRSITGIVLIALGVLMVLSVFSVMEGAVFSIMADMSKGLAGGLSLGLAALLIWAGVLTTMSSKKKVPWKPFILAAVMYLCIVGAVNLLSSEVDHGKWILSYEPKNKLPIEDFLRPQGRFKHLFKPGNEHLLALFQEEVDRRWEDLQYLCAKGR